MILLYSSNRGFGFSFMTSAIHLYCWLHKIIKDPINISVHLSMKIILVGPNLVHSFFGSHFYLNYGAHPWKQLFFGVHWIRIFMVFSLFKACVCYFHQIFIFPPNDSPSKTMKNAFCFIEKALFVLEIFNFLYICPSLFFYLSAIALEDDWR